MMRRGQRGVRRQRGFPGRRHGLRRRLLVFGLLAFAALLGARAFELTVVEHEVWVSRAGEQHAHGLELPAPRGTIYDRDGVPLAASRDAYSLAIATREVTDASALAATLRADADLTAAQAAQAVDRRDPWRVLPGRFGEEAREALDGIPGVHFQRVVERFYPHGALGAEVLGRVNAASDALGGIELEFDSLLAGRPGLAVVRHGPDGRPIPGMMLRVADPEPGRDVVLTIDYELQAIADDALHNAVTATGAAGGDLLLIDPRTGDVLAAVSRDAGRTASNWNGATTPFEPGSTMKPFAVAALLGERRATLEDSIHGEDGRYAIHGRVLTDVHEHGWLTLAEGLRESSNVVLAKAASLLTPAQQYTYLRDFGFGSPTGVTYPAESGGVLRRPRAWSKQSSASLAIGYEIAATPLQLALAYAAIANGGVLVEPRLVKEIRSRDGRVERRFAPRAVRRAVSPHVADAMRTVLVGAVETGTGHAAAMGPFRLAGKTGTVRVTADGRYVGGAYRSTFAGFFPAVDPQLVFVVKLDRPRGDYYGGLTAAPVTRATLEAALAARSTAFDRRAIARRVNGAPGRSGAGGG